MDIITRAGNVSGWYLSSTSNVDPKYRSTIGHIEGLANIRPIALQESMVWCLDNSVFTGKFDKSIWLKQMERLQPYQETCLFVTVPDVVGDCVDTLSQFHQYRSMVTDYPVALVSQDGIYQLRKEIPWGDFDCLFVGGSDEHKLGMEGGWIIQEAKARGKWVHIGRVNSASRLLNFWQADSWDGTNLSFAPSNLSKFHAAVLQVRNMKQSKGMFDDLHHNVFGGHRISESV